MELKPINPENISILYELLENITVPLQNGNGGRAKTFGTHRCMTFGICKSRRTGIYGLSAGSKKFPEIYQEILNVAKLVCPKDFNFNAIHLNRNVVCPPHLDSHNVGESVIVAFGDYEGCDLVVENKIFDINCKPLKFNGALRKHWNTPLISGTKYSLVFFNSGKIL